MCRYSQKKKKTKKKEKKIIGQDLSLTLENSVSGKKNDLNNLKLGLNLKTRMGFIYFT